MSPTSSVLVCDADHQSARGVCNVLSAAGFHVHETNTAEQAIDCAARRRPRAAIIELELPDGDGVELCRRLREWSAMPVIVLSRVTAQAEKVRALNAGADDYLTKPVRQHELVARLEAKLRRADAHTDQPRVERGGLEIDLAARQVRREGTEIHLTPTELDLLRVLATNRGRLVTHQELLWRVWPSPFGRQGQTLRTHIANLRRKIEPYGDQPVICTHYGVGYRLADA